MSDDNLFGLDGDEDLNDDMETVAERAWDGGHESRVLVEEWTAKPLRQFVNTANVIDHIVEYDVEEYLDQYGHATEKLAANGLRWEVIAAFDAALDLLFEGISWRWADVHVATWRVTWEDSEHPEFHYERLP